MREGDNLPLSGFEPNKARMSLWLTGGQIDFVVPLQ
jgi:hypothetical protein